MSESVSDLDWWVATRYPSVHDDWRPSATTTGRHAYNEDAAETPIFHALSTGAWRAREPAAPPARPAQPSRGAQRRTVRERSGSDRPVQDAVEAFRRDPLTMPIPKQLAASTEAARRAAFGTHALRPQGSQPEPSRRSERRRQPEPSRRSERSRQSDRSWESRAPEYSPYSTPRESVSDSGRHHRRRPSISSLL